MIKFNIENGLCRGMTEVFFPPKVRSKKVQKQLDRAAKELCEVCPQIDECRQYALKHEDFGVWGGMNEDERKAERKRLNIHVVRPEIANLEQILSDKRAELNRRRSQKTSTQ